MIKEDRIRILHVGEYAQGGVATYLQTILGSDTEHFSEYLIVSAEKSAHIWPLPDEHVSYYSYKRGMAGVFSAIKAVCRSIRRIKPEIIYCHSTWAGVIGRLAAVCSGTKAKVVYNAHGWAFTMDVSGWKKKIYVLIECFLSIKTDCIVNVSQFEYQAALDVGIPRKKMIVVYSGTAEPEERKHEEDHFFADNVLNLLFVGRFDPQKGLDYLMKQFLKYSNPNIHLYVVGGSVLSEDHYDDICDERIQFLGWIPHEEMAAFYEDCDAVIMPSRWEAFGLVAIEAMKYKKPVIVSNRGALPELIQDGYNGYVFDMEDDASLPVIFDKLDKAELRAMGKNAYCEYQNRFTAAMMRAKMAKVYRQLV